MTILITGSSGFIGKRLYAYAKKQGFNIKTVSRKTVNERNAYLCNLEIDSLPSAAFDGVDTVFHLAGFAHDLSPSPQNTTKYSELNLKATMSIANQAVENKVKHFVFISSTKAGQSGDVDDINLTNHPVDSLGGFYAKTKKQAELGLSDLSSTTDMTISIVRPSLVYGPNVKGNIKRLNNFLDQGLTFSLPHLENKRSMVHVDDLVRAIFLISQRKEKEIRTYIITDLHEYSTSEIINTLSGLKKYYFKVKVPRFLLIFILNMLKIFKSKISKIFLDDVYYSTNYREINFKPELRLEDINETIF
jgi:nucleoside-diphosphate-sugar epimerase|tara:strand:- start:618 stop:1529 length:912 start_codon:yes stop_codon:yes gene_type:complete